MLNSQLGHIPCTKESGLMAMWSEALPLTANCLSPLPRFEFWPGYMRNFPVIWGKAVVFAGFSGSFHQLQMDSHAIWQKKWWKTKFQIPVIKTEWLPFSSSTLRLLPNGAVYREYARFPRKCSEMPGILVLISATIGPENVFVKWQLMNPIEATNMNLGYSYSMLFDTILLELLF